MSLIARNLNVELGGNQILKSVDFRADAGHLVGVLGPSGSGKSTLLLALSGFRPADEGKVELDGTDLYENFDQFNEEIGFVPQDDIVPTALKVERVLQYAAELRLADHPVDVRSGRVDGVIRKLGLSDRREMRVSKLSGGQRKRVNVGVELLVRPKLLLADEPTSGLDPALERSLTQNLADLANDGAIVIVTTHIMTSLDLYDRLAVIHHGRIAFFGPPDEAKPYFEVDDFTAVYAKLETKSPLEWHRHFQSSDLTRYL